MLKLLYEQKLENCQSMYSVLTDHRNDECSENAVSVFDTLLTVQFFERSHVSGFYRLRRYPT